MTFREFKDSDGERVLINLSAIARVTATMVVGRLGDDWQVTPKPGFIDFYMTDGSCVCVAGDLDEMERYLNREFPMDLLRNHAAHVDQVEAEVSRYEELCRADKVDAGYA